MIILALDLSSVSTGYCVIKNKRLLKSSIGSIKTVKKDCLSEKLCYFEDELVKLLQKYNPDVVIVEDIFKGINVKTFKTLAMWRGVAFKAVFGELGIEPICLMPTQARKLAGVDGTKKKDAFDFIVKRYRFSDWELKTHNDLADAVVLALAVQKY